ncbi:MAG TPA: MFS transporter [Streptosporangiaceae bacterium]|jgi:MFS family permease
MDNAGPERRARRAGRSFAAGAQTAGHAGASAAGATSRFVHRLSGASGASRTGLSNLIELTAAGGVGDAFVAVALAGTLFFSASVDQARGRIALALLITIAPFAVLAPFLGPMLDRVQQGRRYILIGTLLARGLLCWGMSGAVQHNDAVTLLPAAFGVLVLQKAYGVTRAAVTPRLLPSEITLVSANARSALGALIATTLGAGAAAGIGTALGGGDDGAAWVLRIGTALYIAAAALGLRLPDGVDSPGADETVLLGPDGTRPLPGTGGPAQPQAAGGAAGRTGLRRIFKMPTIGPVVREAMQANAALRAYSGFMIFFLAFILRTEHFSGTSDKLALTEMIIAAGLGGLLGTGVGAALRSRAPQAIVYGILVFATVVTALCAVFYGLWAALMVALAAALGQALVKLALDSILQREIGEEVRSSTFAVSETLHQLSWVAGGLIGLLLSLTNSGVTGLAVAAGGLGIALCALLLARRKRVLRTRQSPATVGSPVGLRPPG